MSSMGIRTVPKLNCRQLAEKIFIATDGWHPVLEVDPPAISKGAMTPANRPCSLSFAVGVFVKEHPASWGRTMN